MEAILIVAHGNQSGDNTRTEEHARKLSELIGRPVYCAYRRYSENRVKPVMKRIIKDGHTDVVIIPLFMSANMYTNTIPQAMGLRGAGPVGEVDYEEGHLNYRMTPVLGDYPKSAELVADLACIGEETGVVLVSKCSEKGCTDPIIDNSRKIIESRGYPVEWCPNTKDPEPGAEAIERLKSKGAKRIVAVPVAIGATVRFKLEEMEVTESFGSSPRISEIMADMARS